jgi:hypothetical protein
LKERIILLEGGAPLPPFARSNNRASFMALTEQRPPKWPMRLGAKKSRGCGFFKTTGDEFCRRW